MAGIIDTIKLAGVLVFAIPMAIAGIEFLRGGETLFGGALLALAAALVLLKRFLTLPTDIPGLLAKRVVGAASDEPEPNEKE